MSETTNCPEDRIIRTASNWLILLRDEHVSTADKAAFADWLLQSSTHMHEFLWCDQVWSWLEEVDWEKVVVEDEVLGASAKQGCPCHRSLSLH